MAFLGKGAEGEQLFKKALRLNPYRNIWYSSYGAFTCFVQGRFQESIDLALKGPLTEVWVDMPGYIAAAHAQLGNEPKARDYYHVFRKTFQKEITSGKPFTDKEMVSWIGKANPFKHRSHLDFLIEGLVMAGLDQTAGEMLSTLHPGTKSDPKPSRKSGPVPQTNVFAPHIGLWHMRYGGATVQIPEVKGFLDLRRLLDRPGEELHCTELMGHVIQSGSETSLLDEKARRAYEARIRELTQELDEAEMHNDLGRKERLNQELEQLSDHLAKALGLGGRSRKLNASAERARAAVTWRIRSAIRKIQDAHPTLGQHLANAIHTGTFCSYTPEHDHHWELSPPPPAA
jgi:tetratricopeptide (TPR) repeat protein